MPTPAEEVLAKTILPTGLSSEEIRVQVPAEIRRRSFFSARTAEAEYLVKARQVCADVAAGKIGQSEARFQLEQFLEQVGYTRETGLTPGHEGAITDIGSIARLDLIIDTQRDMAHSVAMLDAQTDANLDEFPAWRLVRYGSRRDPRDWNARWNEAARQVNWEGVARNGDFVALKSSPIWEAIGAGAGNHKTALSFNPAAKPTGHLEKAARNTIWKAGADGALVTVTSPGITRAFRQLDIRAKGKMLTIPARPSPEAYGKRAREVALMEPLFFVKSKSGGGFLATGDARKATPAGRGRRPALPKPGRPNRPHRPEPKMDERGIRPVPQSPSRRSATYSQATRPSSARASRGSHAASAPSSAIMESTRNDDRPFSSTGNPRRLPRLRARTRNGAGRASLRGRAGHRNQRRERACEGGLRRHRLHADLRARRGKRGHPGMHARAGVLRNGG